MTFLKKRSFAARLDLILCNSRQYLANRYSIQVNKTSRNSVLLQSNINNTRSDIAHLIRVLVEISSEIDQRLVEGGPQRPGKHSMRAQRIR